MAPRERRARVDDIHDMASALPGVSLYDETTGNPIYQVGKKSFIFFRTPRPDALDAETGERLTDVIVFWVADEGEKQALLADPAMPFFTTPHFDGHRSVLIRGSRVPELSRTELQHLVEEAWLAQAPKRVAKQWLDAQHPNGT